jgi:hypothetical protein
VGFLLQAMFIIAVNRLSHHITKSIRTYDGRQLTDSVSDNLASLQDRRR